MRAWIDGALLDDPGGPAIRVTDHGFTVGDGVFEAIKVVAGEPFALDLHLGRLARSAAGLGLPEIDEASVRRGVAAVLDGQDLPLGRIRITVTGGPAPLGSGRGDHPSTVAVVAAPMDPAPGSTTVVTVPWPRNERGALAGLKTTSYAENVVALAEARRHGASEAIFANLAGPPVRGHRLQRLLRRRRRAADAEPGQRVPGRGDARAPARLVRRPRGRRADRGRRGRRRGLPGLHHPRRAAGDAVGRRASSRSARSPREAAAAWRRREPELLGR